MLILALDATEQACSVALLNQSTCVEQIEIAPRRHGELLLPMVNAVLTQAGCASEDIGLLAFSAGPGAFTGLRIASAVIQGLAFAWDCPVMPVSTLAALARGAHRVYGGNYFLPAMDARMEQIYWAGYEIRQGVPYAICPDQLSVPDEVDFSWASHNEKFYQGIGSGWCYGEILINRWREATQKVIPCVDDHFACHAQDVAFCAQAALNQGQLTVTAEQALPVYIRETQFKKHIPSIARNFL